MSLLPSGFSAIVVFFFALDGADPLIPAQFATEFLLTIMTLQKNGSVFVITRNSIKNHDIFHLTKYLNARYVV